MRTTIRPSTARPRRVRRAAAAVTMTALGMAGVAACGDTDPQEVGPTSADVQALEEEVASLQERLDSLEDSPGDGGEVLPGVDLDELLEDPQSFLGEEVTVTGEISELWTTGDAGTAFRIAGDAGDPIVVVAPGFSEQLDENDDVEVTGTITSLSADTFEADFGIPADGLLENLEGFLGEAAGEPAMLADSVEIVEPSS